MAKEAIRKAIETIQEELDKILLEVKKKKQAINVLHETIGEEPVYEIEGESGAKRILKPDQFYGRSFTASAIEVLKIRGQACTAEEIFRGLEEGGYDFPWKPDDRLRSVAVTLSKNSQTFHKLPNGTIGLLEWYPEIAKRKKVTAKDVINSIEELEKIVHEKGNQSEALTEESGEVKDPTEKK